MRQLGIEMIIPIMPNVQFHDQHQILNQRNILPNPPAVQNHPAQRQQIVHHIPANNQQIHQILHIPAINQGPNINQQQVPQNLPMPAVNQQIPIQNRQVPQNLPMPAINQQIANQNQQVPQNLGMQAINQEVPNQIQQVPVQNRNTQNPVINENERQPVVQNPNPQQLRRSNRIRKPTVRYGFNVEFPNHECVCITWL
ncbi:unnamed protein product [Mytilus edulis]|uniref:Uncharacterized protein n=1 Tax=Mytilus edulis TaxID=6550 RepID=A0A8S3TNN1_MYTED|nr:unnamed protein product [Mytilus edulis]